MNQKKDNIMDISPSALERAFQSLSLLENKVVELEGAYSALKRQHLLLERQYQALCQAEQRLRDKQEFTREKVADIIAALKMALSQMRPVAPTKPVTVLETEE
jgi:exonuclease VII small subunit